MAINLSVQYNNGFLPDVILLTQCYYHGGIRLNAMKKSCLAWQPMFPRKRFVGGMLRRLDAFRFLFEQSH